MHTVLTSGQWKPTRSLVARLSTAYKLALEEAAPETGAIWSGISGLQKPLHDALISNTEDLPGLLANPKQTNLYYGVDNLARDVQDTPSEGGAAFLLSYAERLATALGLQRLWNPEGGLRFKPGERPQAMDIEAIIAALPRAIDFPNPFPGEVGMHTSRGTLSYRPIHAVYQALRIKTCLDRNGGKRVLEIGAGMGRTAYYAHRLGFDYTIVDIPMTMVGQACFLAATLGDHAISLPGERSAPILLRSPQWIDTTKDRFDIAINVDSMPEMSREYASKYLDFIKRRCRFFLSINHEANEFTVRELAADILQTRHPYIMRDGYVEEFAAFPESVTLFRGLLRGRLLR
jgi:hypothetical protein